MAASATTPLTNWEPCAPLKAPSVRGKYIQIDPFDAENDPPLLWEALGGVKETVNERLKYFFWLGDCPPFETASDLARVLNGIERQDGWCVNVFRLLQPNDDNKNEDSTAPQPVVCGMSSFVNAAPVHGTVEVGYVAHGLAMAQSPASTEAHYLLAKHVLETHAYRRYEWKCDSNNLPSKKTAQRLGFQYEGTFRQHRLLWNKQNRDTCWYSMLDSEWPQRRTEFEAWLADNNFDSDGRQLKRLEVIRAEAS